MVRLGGIGTADVGGSSPEPCSSCCPSGACSAVSRRSAAPTTWRSRLIATTGKSRSNRPAAGRTRSTWASRLAAALCSVTACSVTATATGSCARATWSSSVAGSPSRDGSVWLSVAASAACASARALPGSGLESEQRPGGDRRLVRVRQAEPHAPAGLPVHQGVETRDGAGRRERRTRPACSPPTAADPPGAPPPRRPGTPTGCCPAPTRPDVARPPAAAPLAGPAPRR